MFTCCKGLRLRGGERKIHFCSTRFVDEKRYYFCGKGFRKLMFKPLIWYIAPPPRRRAGGTAGRRAPARDIPDNKFENPFV